MLMACPREGVGCPPGHATKGGPLGPALVHQKRHHTFQGAQQMLLGTWALPQCTGNGTTCPKGPTPFHGGCARASAGGQCRCWGGLQCWGQSLKWVFPNNQQAIGLASWPGAASTARLHSGGPGVWPRAPQKKIIDGCSHRGTAIAKFVSNGGGLCSLHHCCQNGPLLLCCCLLPPHGLAVLLLLLLLWGAATVVAK